MARKKALWTKLNSQPNNPTAETVDSLHEQLVKKAADWLFRTKRCAVVITEMCGGSTETPDAIGWRGHASILVECKTSRSDFFADKKKISRIHSPHGIGTLRYYLVPHHMFMPDEMPDKWGMLVLGANNRIVTFKDAEPFEDTNHGYEKAMLVSCLRRIGHTAPAGVSINCYTIETKRRATLGVRKEEQ